MIAQGQRAFTLLELLISMSILGLLLGFALPALSQFLYLHRDESLRNMLLSYLHQARAHSIVQQKSYQLCGSSNGLDCDHQWNAYWLVAEANSTQPELILQIPKGSTLCWSGFTKVVRFQANGTSPSSNGRFTLCREQKPRWELIINRQGRVRTGDPETASCCT